MISENLVNVTFCHSLMIQPYMYQNSNIDELFAIANEQLDNLFTCFCANKLCLNESKTKYIVIRPSHMRPDLKQVKYCHKLHTSRLY